MKIGLGADHRGFRLKNEIKDKLIAKGYDIIDYGTNNTDIAHYPIYAIKVGEALENDIDYGVLICGNGIGMSIAANKVKGARCALVHDAQTAVASKADDNSNILALLGDKMGADEAVKIIEEWLNAEFKGGRYQHRIDMIDNYENNR